MNTRKERAANRRRQQRITNTLVIVGGIVLIVVVAFLFTQGAPTQAVSLAQVGKAFGNFSLKDIQGQSVQMSDYAGKVVLVNAWATWCPPCKAEMPDLNAYYQAHQQDNFVILAINAGDPASAAADFVAQKGLTFPVLLDPNTALLNGLGINSYPTSILVGMDGMVKAIHVGMFTPQSLEEEITPYLTR